MNNRRLISTSARRGAHKSSAFSPKSLAGLDWWWDATNSASYTLSGNLVTAFHNLGTNAWDGTPPGGGEPTRVASGINSKASFNFDPAGTQYAVLPDRFGAFTQYEIHVVGKCPDDPPGASSGPWLLGTSGSATYLPFAGDRKVYDDFGIDTQQAATFAPGAGAWGTPWLYSVVVTAATWKNYFGGVLQYTGTSPGAYTNVAFKTGTVWFGRNASALPMRGQIGEVVGYSTPLSASKRATLIAYLKAKWGIA